jgi:ribosomal protein S6
MTENNETTVDSRVYEISFIFDNKLDEGTALEKSNAIKQSIATLGGSFISEEAPYMRELAYEMIRVVNNVNIRFNVGYFGWIKFELDASKVKELEKGLKLDEEVIRYLVVSTVRENTVYTKRAPVIKAETLVDNDVDIDTTGDAEIVEGKIAPLPVEETSEEVK